MEVKCSDVEINSQKKEGVFSMTGGRQRRKKSM